MRNRSLTDRTQDSDSCNVGSIPAGCSYYPEEGPTKWEEPSGLVKPFSEGEGLTLITMRRDPLAGGVLMVS